MYEIYFSKQAKKFLVKIDDANYKILFKTIQSLSKEVLPKSSKKLVNILPPTFRVRVKKFRILYTINFEESEIFISKIDKRDKVYN